MSHESSSATGAAVATRRVRVDSATAPYEVVIGTGVITELAGLVEGAARVAVLHPASLTELVSVIRDALAPTGAELLTIALPDGEAAKTAEVLVDCWDRLGEAGFTRSDLVIGFGGGATTDLAGFVAASWLRGVGFISVPTTVLGMVDAAVGGKTGINTAAGKNLVGAFHEPRGVLCELSLLEHLPLAEVRSGLAEIIKCGFIAEPRILDLVEQDPAALLRWDSAELARAIAHGIEVKAQVVANDLTERTSVGSEVARELLNYGHTYGHAVERHENFRVRHGEAVSIGMVYIAELAHRLGLMSAELTERHRTVLAAVGLPITHHGDWTSLRALISKDKKARGTTVRFVALTDIAQPLMLTGPDEETMRAAHEALAD